MAEQMRAVADEIAKVVVGQEAAIRHLLICVACGGHALVEDVPGTGKTTLVKALSAALGCGFARIQFTPDLLPGDVTGSSVFDERTAEFVFHPGPIFSGFVLADEINRASPKTQSALLEAMGEGQVTADGKSHPLPRPFFVMATRNPVELEGTYPLPEAQVDRFLMQVRLARLDEDHECDMLARVLGNGGEGPAVRAAAGPQDVLGWQQARAAIELHPDVRRYCVQLAQETRRHGGLRLGASPRATVGLAQAAQARALVEGRAQVIPDDVQEVAEPVLGHRLVVDGAAQIDGVGAADVVRAVVSAVPVPV